MNATLRHLVRRAVTSWKNTALSDTEVAKAQKILNSDEHNLWMAMQPRDCRHSLMVLARFDELCPLATREERAAALLHDVGKLQSDLGWTMRIVATIVGPRGKRFSLYHDHEALGAEMLKDVSHHRTIDLVHARVSDDVSRALQLADDI